MDNTKLFVYGILKKGYELDLANYGAKFLGEAHIEGATLYGIGPYRVGDGLIDDAVQKYHGVGLRLNTYPWSEGDPRNIVAHGELWEVPGSLWRWLDDIEQNGFCYTRKIVPVVVEQWKEPIKRTEAGLVTAMAALDRMHYTDAWVYEHTYPNFKYEYPIKGGKF